MAAHAVAGAGSEVQAMDEDGAHAPPAPHAHGGDLREGATRGAGPQPPPQEMDPSINGGPPDTGCHRSLRGLLADQQSHGTAQSIFENVHVQTGVQAIDELRPLPREVL